MMKFMSTEKVRMRAHVINCHSPAKISVLLYIVQELQFVGFYILLHLSGYRQSQNAKAGE